MKLLRLTSNNNNGIIETNFKEDIKIDENSQISLLNASFSKSQLKFEVDTGNDEIKYNDSLNSESNSILTKKVYDKTTAKELFKDITDKINNNLIETGQNIGSQFLCSNDGGTTLLQTRISPNNGKLYEELFETPNGKKTDDINNTVAQNNYSADRLTTRSNTDEQFLSSFKPWGKGFSTLRCQIKRLRSYPTDITQNGFIIGLSNKNPKDWVLDANNELPLDDKTYYCRIGDTSQQNHIFTKSKGDLAERLPDDNSITLARSGNNAIPIINFIQLDKKGKTIEWRLYKNQSGITQPIILRTITIDNIDEDLYPFIIIRGNTDQLQLGNIKYTLDPYKTNLSKYLNPVETVDYEEGLGVVPIVISNGRQTIKSFEFQNNVIANFLGFDSNILPNEAGTRGEYKNKAKNQFKILIENPYFVIRTNLDLEAYDGDLKGRFNILSTFGNDDNVLNSVFYEANNPIFLDIKNSTPRSIRNIRCEILNADLSRVVTDGFISLTLLIK